MTPTVADFEEQLRALYLTVEAPPAPSLPDAEPPTHEQPTRHRPLWRNHWARRGLAAAATAAVVLAATLVANRHTAPGPQPGLHTQLLSVHVTAAGASLDCSLPIVALSADQTRGFVVLHNGRASFQPANVPQGAYIAALHRWVDGTPRRLNDADTTYYTAPSDPNSLTITVHDEHSARVVYTGSSMGPNPMGWFGTEIVLFQSGSSLTGPSQQAHIQLLDPATGALRTVPGAIRLSSDFGANGSQTGYIPVSGAMWTLFSRDDGTRTALDRYDLTTGATTRVYTTTGFIAMVGVDSSAHPIIQVGSRDIFHIDPAKHTGITTTTLLVTAPGQSITLNDGRVGDPGVADNLSPLSLTDGAGVWMAADNGQIWRYTRSTGMQLIAKVTTSTQGAPGVAIEGPCR
jgi:hypothetical protein